MNRNLQFVTLSLFAWGIGEGMFTLFQPLYLRELGADPFLIGTILGAMGVAMTLAQVPSGYLSDRIGTRPLMWVSWITATISAWIMALAPNLPVFTVGLILFGLTNSVLAPMNAYITHVRGTWSAEKALSVTAAAYHLGAVLGPVLGGFLGAQISLRFLYQIAALVFMGSTTLIFFIKNIKITEEHEQSHQNNLLRNRPFMRLLPLSFITLFFMFFAQPFSSVYLEEVKLIGLQQIGYLGAIGSLGNVVLALTIGQFSAKTAYFLSFPFVFLFSALMVKTNHFFGFALAYFCFGGYRLAKTMLLALSKQFVRSSQTGIAFGFIEATNGIAAILAPPLSGLIYNQQPDLIFWTAGIGILIVFVVNISLLGLKKEKIHA